ncbi:hypothetical protein L6452_01333 [Arctium lappa]|uniref:Uncharacterized protein n=1 Tax=Arctium lappa TaxID=4217 RepID=A0ACB9FHE6_ARCLA|nr:hypothetical protein L6452_01333 [Arctium lappa]
MVCRLNHIFQAKKSTIFLFSAFTKHYKRWRKPRLIKSRFVQRIETPQRKTSPDFIPFSSPTDGRPAIHPFLRLQPNSISTHPHNN